MTDTRPLTMREHAEARAAGEFLTAMREGKILHLELVKDCPPTPDAKRFAARALKGGTVRVGIVYHWPGLAGALYHGAEVHPADVARWFSERGIPVVRFSARAPKL
jgi:hypothetical protein